MRPAPKLVARASRILPAGALALFACLQILFAQTRGLTPWKGGGFGMFSTVDSPDARFFRIYLLTPEGKVPITLPSDLYRLSGHLRSIPSQGELNELAQKLAARTWVPRTYNDLSATPECALPSVCYQRRPGCSSPLPPFYRALSPREPEPSGQDRVPFSAVEVELWKSRFDLPQHRLVAARLLQASATRSAGNPPAGEGEK